MNLIKQKDPKATNTVTVSRPPPGRGPCSG